MPATSTYQPPLATLADMASHHAWTSSCDVSKGKVTFEAYVSHHPTGYPIETYGFSFNQDITISWSDSSNAYYIKTPSNRSRESLPEERHKIAEVLNEAFEESLEKLHRSRYPRRRLTRPVVNTLSERYESYYEALTAPAHELKSLDGIGEKRLENLKDGTTTQRYYEEWCWLTRCPACDEEWWSPQAFEQDDSDPTAPSEPPLEPLQEKMYCPVCKHTEIPSGYYSGPYRFDEDVISSYSTPVPGESEGSSGADLRDYV